MPRPLRFHPAPFRSSNLAIPHSPFSPRLPLTPPPAPSQSVIHSVNSKHTATTEPPPQAPLAWLWQCHMCHHTYPLGTTHRCLDDGHFFCAGTTTVKSRRGRRSKTKRHRACASEFDYQGWKAWGEWRREQQSSAPPRPTSNEKNCADMCDYPSECRWGKQYGVQTPPASAKAVSPVVAALKLASAAVELPPPPPPSTFDDILGDSPHMEGSISPTMPTPTRDFWSTLLASATRRKSAGQTHTSSPLALHPVEPTTTRSDWTNKETTLAAPKPVKMSSESAASADAAGLGRFHAALPSLKELLGLPTPALSASSVRSAVSGVRSTLAPVEKKDVFMGGTEDLDVGMLMG